MVRSKVRLGVCSRTLQKRFRLGVPAPSHIQIGQVDKARGDSWIFRASFVRILLVQATEGFSLLEGSHKLGLGLRITTLLVGLVAGIRIGFPEGAWRKGRCMDARLCGTTTGEGQDSQTEEACQMPVYDSTHGLQLLSPTLRECVWELRSECIEKMVIFAGQVASLSGSDQFCNDAPVLLVQARLHKGLAVEGPLSRRIGGNSLPFFRGQYFERDNEVDDCLLHAMVRRGQFQAPVKDIQAAAKIVAQDLDCIGRFAHIAHGVTSSASVVKQDNALWPRRQDGVVRSNNGKAWGTVLDSRSMNNE